MMADLQDDIKALEKEERERNTNIMSVVLKGYAGRAKDVSGSIGAILDGTKNVKDALGPIRDLVAGVIVDAADNCLTVVEYRERTKSKQNVFLFVGTHWMLIDTQLYYDFIRWSCLKCGLPEIYVYDPGFMNKLFEAVAFRVSEYRSTYIPSDGVWINMRNGTLEIDGGGNVVLREHRKEDFFIYCLDYCYDAKAICPEWLKFLDEVLPDLETQQLLAESFGYCFTRNLKLEKMFVFLGGGSNGKSVTMDVMRHVFGTTNVGDMSLSLLTTDDEKRADLEKKLVNISSESDLKLDTSVLKRIVSGEPIDVRRLYENTHIMYHYGKLFTSFNKLPPAEHTHGFFRRWIIIPYRVTIPEERQDPTLAARLKGESAGILNWVLAVLPGMLSRRGFSISKECNQALSEYKRRSNSALSFLEDRCVKADDGRFKLKELYSKYCTFCQEEGIKNKFGKTAFRDIVDGWGAEQFAYQGFIMYKLKSKEET